MPWNAVHTQCEHHQLAKDDRRGLAIAGVAKVHDGIGLFVPAGALRDRRQRTCILRQH